MRLRPLQPEELTSTAADCGVDAGEFPAEVYTPFGQRIVLSKDGRWCSRLEIEHVGCTPVIFHWGARFSRNPLVEWAFRTWAIERIQSRVDLRPATEVGKALEELSAPKVADEGVLEDEISNWSQCQSARSLARAWSHRQIGIRKFVAWGLEECLPGFTDHTLNRLLEIPLAKHGAQHLVSMLAEIDGPYTYAELRAIEEALAERTDLVREKAMYLLARDWGLRPIQLALMRIDDLREDDLGPFVWVPSVKGVRRSHARRSGGNMKKRYVSDETRDAVILAIEEAREVSVDLRAQLVTWGLCTPSVANALPTPLFPASRTQRRSRVYARDPAILEYILHSDSGLVSRQVRALTNTLAIPSLRSPRGVDDSVHLEIGLLRLRRTKGTTMILQGASIEEVAEALDHLNPSTVAHYARLNRDLIDFFEESQSKSPSIAEAIRAWSGRLTRSDKEGSKGGLRISGLGRCHLGKPCQHHPTVTCYGCRVFEPFVEGDHRGAKANILAFKQMIDGSSTGPVRKQMSAALAGVDGVLLAIEHGAHA